MDLSMTAQSWLIRSSSRIIVKFLKFMKLIFWVVGVRVIRQIFQLKFMIKNRSPTFVALLSTFNDRSVSCNLLLKIEVRQFDASGNRRIKNQFQFHNSKHIAI